MCKAKRWKLKKDGSARRRKKEKKRCVQHFESGHGYLHEHHLWRWWECGQRDRAWLRAPHPLLRGHLHIAPLYPVVNAVKQEGNSAFQSVWWLRDGAGGEAAHTGSWAGGLHFHSCRRECTIWAGLGQHECHLSLCTEYLMSVQKKLTTAEFFKKTFTGAAPDNSRWSSKERGWFPPGASGFPCPQRDTDNKCSSFTLLIDSFLTLRAEDDESVCAELQ